MRETQTIVDVINKSLKDLYSTDIVTGLPIFRIVWSEDEMEKRYGTFDDFLPGTQIFLRTVTETREVPKYRQWIHNKHILERLVLVPEFQQHELPSSKVSYEPLWVFEDRVGNYLPPRLDAAKFIIDGVLEAQIVNTMMITGKESQDKPNLARYIDPEGTTEGAKAFRKQEIDGMVEELFGDETGLMGQTLSRSQGGGQAIIVPHNYKD